MEETGNETWVRENVTEVDDLKQLVCTLLENIGDVNDSYYSCLYDPLINKIDRLIERN